MILNEDINLNKILILVLSILTGVALLFFIIDKLIYFNAYKDCVEAFRVSWTCVRILSGAGSL